jgi:acyl-CoA thioester hydrolase
MPRIKLDLPDQIHFSAEIKVRVTDLNYGGHVGNDAIVGMLQEARVQFFQSLGYKDELNIEGVGTIQTDLAIVYKSEAFLGETIIIDIQLDDHNKYGFDIIYLLKSKPSNREIARAKTGIIFFDYQPKKVSKVPEPFLKKLKN